MPLSPSQSAQIPLIAPISSLLKPASVCLGGPEFPQLVRTARSSKKPRRPSQRVRELGNCQVAPVLKLHRLCGKSSAESYEPFRYKCSCLVSLSLDSLESWAFAHFFYCILLLCCPKVLEPGMSMSTLPVWRAFVPLLSLFSWQKLTKDCTILCGPEGQQVAYAQTDIVCSNFKG